MFAGTASLSSALLFVCVFVVVSADQKNIRAQSGQEVTLPCRAPNNNIILGVEWSRADLGDKYVLFYRNEQFDSENQHPSFKNRVDLQDRQMKDGDVSLILKNVTINDNGTYKCVVFMRGPITEHISIIYLHVDPPGQTGGDTEDGGKKNGSVGLKVGLSVSAVLLVAAAVVGFVIYKCRQPKHRQNSCQHTDDLQHGNGSVTHTESERPALLNQTEG